MLNRVLKHAIKQRTVKNRVIISQMSSKNRLKTYLVQSTDDEQQQNRIKTDK